MANALYPTFFKHLANGDIDWVDDTIKVTLVDTGDYTYSSAHEFYSSVHGAGAVAVATLATKTNTLGVLDAADTTFTAATGDQSEALVIWKDTGDNATSPLIAYIDTAASGLPVTPNGGDIVITWNAGANKIINLNA